MVNIQINKSQDEDCLYTNKYNQSMSFQTRHETLLKLPLEKVVGFQKSNVTLQSQRGTREEVIYILCGKLVKQLEKM